MSKSIGARGSFPYLLWLCGSLLLSNFAYIVLDWLLTPLLGSQRRCHADALSPGLPSTASRSEALTQHISWQHCGINEDHLATLVNMDNADNIWVSKFEYYVLHYAVCTALRTTLRTALYTALHTALRATLRVALRTATCTVLRPAPCTALCTALLLRGNETDWDRCRWD